MGHCPSCIFIFQKRNDHVDDGPYTPFSIIVYYSRDQKAEHTISIILFSSCWKFDYKLLQTVRYTPKMYGNIFCVSSPAND